MRHMQMLIIVLLSLFIPVIAQAEEDVAPFTVGIDMATGWQAQLGDQENSEVRMLFIHTQLINKLHDNLQWVNEMTVGWMGRPAVGFIIGANEIVRIRLSAFPANTVFIDLGAGVNHFGPHENVPELDGPSQFSVIGGIGYAYRTKGSNIGYTLSYRMTHFSNASTAGVNIGLNLHTVALGVNLLSKK